VKFMADLELEKPVISDRARSDARANKAVL
jgi:hypothetical protein